MRQRELERLMVDAYIRGVHDTLAEEYGVSRVAELTTGYKGYTRHFAKKAVAKILKEAK